MKIAISSSGKELEAQLDPRFGRCRYFLIVDPGTLEFEVFENENGALGGGAGIQSAQFVVSKGVEAVITGNCGPNAMQVISAAGVPVHLGQSGTVRDIVEAYKNGRLTTSTEANVNVHAGMGGRGMGRGMGMGRVMGMGGGRRAATGVGMGRGGGQGRGKG
jgi:predicted Fe-Mo cluster-binding NifX family protein